MLSETKWILFLVCVMFIWINVVLVNEYLPQFERFDQYFKRRPDASQLSTDIHAVYCVMHMSKCQRGSFNIIDTLAKTLHLPQNAVAMETKLVEDGMPLYFCQYDQICCKRHRLYDIYFKCKEGNIDMLAHFSFERDMEKATKNAARREFAVYWKAFRDSKFLSTKSKSFLDLLGSYQSILKEGNLSKTLGCSVTSWSLLQITKQNNKLVPVEKFFTSRKKRSVSHTPGFFTDKNNLNNIPPHPTMPVQFATILPTNFRHTANSTTVTKPHLTEGRPATAGTLSTPSSKTVAHTVEAVQSGSGSHNIVSGSGSLEVSSKLTLEMVSYQTTSQSASTTVHTSRSWHTSVPLWNIADIQSGQTLNTTALSNRYIPSIIISKLVGTIVPKYNIHHKKHPKHNFLSTVIQPNLTTIFEVVTQLALINNQLLTTKGYLSFNSLTTSSRKVPKVINITTTIGRAFLFEVPLHWTYSASTEKEFFINSSMPLDSINSTSTTWLGMLSDKSMFKWPTLLTINTRTTKWPSSLLLQFNEKISPFKHQYLVTVNCSVYWNPKESVVISGNHFATIEASILLFVQKLANFLPYVYIHDITVRSWNQSLLNHNPTLGERKHVEISWLIDKFSYKSFTSHYFPLMAIPDENQCTEKFFFAMLPEFVINEISLLQISSNIEEDDVIVEARNSLAVVLPICIVGVFMTVSSVLLVVRHKRKKLQNSSLWFSDRTFSKPRKPICLENEVEMDTFQPTKPRILLEERRVVDTVVDENEITFPSSSLSNSSIMNVSDTDVSCGDNRHFSGYSFVNARFQSNGDGTSISSDTSTSSFVFKEMLVMKRGK